ncbi:MAG: hypothetical protein WD066_12270 [Planctomycetaceae bacterium]
MSRDEIESLLDQAAELQHGPTQVALAEQAVRLADSTNDVDVAFEARELLVYYAVFSDFDEKAIVAFSWCLARSDAEPERFSPYKLLAEYQWIIGSATTYPGVSLERIDAMTDDLLRRLEERGHSPRSGLATQLSTLRFTGRLNASQEVFDAWRRAPRDEYTECVACEQDAIVDLHLVLDRFDLAWQSARPLLDGTMKCGSFPQTTTQSSLMWAMACRGDEESARDMHQLSFQAAVVRRKSLDYAATHLLFTTWAAETRRAVKTFESVLSWAAERGTPWQRCEFYSAAAVFLESLATRGNRRRRFRLPPDLPCRREHDSYKPAELADWFHQEAWKLAEQFDARNGNTWFSDTMRRNREVALSGCSRAAK